MKIKTFKLVLDKNQKLCPIRNRLYENFFQFRSIKFECVQSGMLHNIIYMYKGGNKISNQESLSKRRKGLRTYEYVKFVQF